MPTWKLNSLQIVWFVDPSSVDLRPEALYHSLVGTLPQSTQRNQLPGAPPDYVNAIATGQDSGKSYQLNAQPGRIDFVISAANPPLAPRSPPLLDDPRAVIDDLLSRVSRSNPVEPSVSRVAVVGNFWSLEDTPNQATQKAIGRVGLGQDWSGASDFNFQINKRMAFDENVFFNRLLAWSTPIAQLIEFQPTNNMFSFSPASHVVEYYAAALNIDLNTFVENPQSFSKEYQSSLFEGLKHELLRLWEINSPNALLAS